ncbi:hypothetical protein [Granulicella aggregans]|nr:hypothetical protein [Granulicella aggregans]
MTVMLPLEELGIVTSRSGILLLIDTGYLRLWSHDRVPEMPDGVLSDDGATATANTFVDLRIVGADAERVGQLLGMSWNPFYVYDQPPTNLELRNKLDSFVREQKLDARFEVVNPRISHRQRVDLAIKQGKGAGEIQFHGVWAAAVSGVPTATPLRVVGERGDEQNPDRWRRVIVECQPGKRYVQSHEVGLVGVDYARILIADVDVLGGWKHEESLDGMADFLFWGRDAERIAATLHAPRVGSREFGWVDLPTETATGKGIAVQEYRDKHSLKIAVDYRPHSHHWQVMRPIRESSPTESSTTEIDGEKVCNFMTTWGDGLFQVYRDIDGSGQLVQIRIEMETLPGASPS